MTGTELIAIGVVMAIAILVILAWLLAFHGIRRGKNHDLQFIDSRDWMLRRRSRLQADRAADSRED